MEYVCPVCKHCGKEIRQLPSEFLREQLCIYFSTQCPSSITIPSYSLAQCEKCGLIFANPMQGGSEGFYSWIIQQKGLRPTHRWEYDIVLSEIAARDAGTILDVGCGSGHFLQGVINRTKATPLGLDLSKKAVEICRADGIPAECGDLQSFVSEGSAIKKQFDCIVSFHCLEHVDDPLGQLRLMKRLLTNEGRIYVSTPYSPTCYDYSWFDSLNHPPYHLTKWRIPSYEELARQLDMRMKYYMADADTLIRRVIYTTRYKYIGLSKSVMRTGMLFLMIRHPFFTLREIVRQIRREKVDGKIAGNSVLVRFEKK